MTTDLSNHDRDHHGHHQAAATSSSSLAQSDTRRLLTVIDWRLCGRPAVRPGGASCLTDWHWVTSSRRQRLDTVRRREPTQFSTNRRPVAVVAGPNGVVHHRLDNRAARRRANMQVPRTDSNNLALLNLLVVHQQYCQRISPANLDL